MLKRILLLLLTTLTAAGQTKVVFIGDQFTYNWSSACANNPNWINQGTLLPADGLPTSGSSGGALASFQTDVIDLHPAIVHIMLGSDDVIIPGDEAEPFVYSGFTSNMQQMIKMAKAANIQVVLGIESPEWPDEGGGYLQYINSIVATLGAQNNLPVINYADALCACVGSTVGSTGEFGVISSTAPVAWIGTNFATQLPYMTKAPNGPFTPYAPNPEGYALMTQMAEATINTLGVPLRGGYLQNELQANYRDGPTKPKANVTNVYWNDTIQFTPYGQYSNGITEPLINSTYAGSTGTWASSNPLVMWIDQKGLATALAPGGVVITYKSPSGVAFNEWRIHVQDGYCGSAYIPC
jgi:lysophospholipase L1-like esterase